MKQFQNELTKLINRHSLENESNTPDYILSDYLVRCLKNFNETSTHRVDWHTSTPIESHQPQTTTDCNYTVGIDGPGEELKQPI